MNQPKYSEHFKAIGGEGKRKEIAALYGVSVESVSFSRTELSAEESAANVQADSSLKTTVGFGVKAETKTIGGIRMMI